MSDASEKNARTVFDGSPSRTVARRRAAAALLAVLAALVMVAALAPALRGGKGTFAELSRAAGGTFCHQRPERTLHLGGVPLAVCARCTGLLAGGLAGLALVALGAGGGLRRTGDRRPLLAGLVLLTAHVVWGAAGLPDGGLVARAATGALAAAAFAPHLADACLELMAAARLPATTGEAAGALEVDR